MSVKERKEREKEEMRELILNTANKIILSEGIEKLSIRKLANKIEYSPSVIYHYFEDKEQIVDSIMGRGYKKILSALSSVQSSYDKPEDKIKDLIRRYIEAALKMPDEYKAVHLSSSDSMLQYTSSLFKGASYKKPALNILFDCLKDIFKTSSIDEDILELTAQIIAVSSFGLIIKLIIERDISEEQKNRLVDHYVNCIVDGMIMGKSLAVL